MSDFQYPHWYRTVIVRRSLRWATGLGTVCGAVSGTLIIPIIGTVAGAIVGAVVGLTLGLLNAVALCVAARLPQPVIGAAALSATVSGLPVYLVCADGPAGGGRVLGTMLALFCAALGAALGPAVLARSAAECREAQRWFEQMRQADHGPRATTEGQW